MDPIAAFQDDNARDTLKTGAASFGRDSSQQPRSLILQKRLFPCHQPLGTKTFLSLSPPTAYRLQTTKKTLWQLPLP